MGDAVGSRKDRWSSGTYRKYTDSAIEAMVDALFNKRLEISNEFSLPGVDSMFHEPSWTDERLLRLKRDLNTTKSRLNDYRLSEWGLHTRSRNKTAELVRYLRQDLRVEFVTQAWCKFYENASVFPLVSEGALKNGKFRTVHLCEAPGAFVASLNHWLKSQVPEIDWVWIGTSLNPHWEGNALTDMIKVDSMINETEKNWHWGVDGTGELASLENLDSLVERAGANTVDLVTADGSIDCVDTPDEQERVVSHLHYCEAIAALHLLAPGGNFLIKVFTIFECRSICLVYLLACCFRRLIINKPATSREGSSEVYLVCLGFKGGEFVAPYLEILRSRYEKLPSEAMFRREHLPEAFLDRIVECGEFFAAHQCETILANIRTFKNKHSRLEPDMGETKRIVAHRFIQEYNLRPLKSQEARILSNNCDRTGYAKNDSLKRPSSYNARRWLRSLKPRQLLAVMASEIDLADGLADGVRFELDDVQCDLVISTGKPYEKIESSKFSAAHELHTCNEIFRLAKELGFTDPLPSSDRVEEFIRENTSVRILNFEYTSAPVHHELIKRLREALETKEKDESFVLLGYHMLSRLNVGLLYLLAHTFEAVEIEASEKLGCVIKLRKFTGNPEVTKMLAEIFQASLEAEKRGHVVLSVLPIKTLLGSRRYWDIVRMNHAVMKHCVQHVIASTEERVEPTG